MLLVFLPESAQYLASRGTYPDRVRAILRRMGHHIAGKGRYLARALGNASVVLLRGHGSVTAGRDLPEAVFRAVYLELNARIQTNAVALGGEIEFLTDEEAHAGTEADAAQTARPWALWSEQAQARRAMR